MMNKHNVFISWSGDRRKFIADALYEWLPMVVQSVKPWMSSHSIDKGSRGALEMAKALDGTKVGISCLTPENLAEPWILYEAGCLTKTIDDSTRLCTYLLGGLKNRDIQPPLGQFQHTSPDKDDTRVLVNTINKAVGGDEPLSEKTLDAVFNQFWPVLEAKINAFPAAPRPVTNRPIEDMIAEILEFTRSETNRRSSIFQLVDADPKNYVAFSGGQLGNVTFDSQPIHPIRFIQGEGSNQLKIVGGAFDFGDSLSGTAQPKAAGEKTDPDKAKKSE